MKPRTSLYAISLACMLAVACLPCVAADRQIAITIDDLPAGAANWMSAAEINQMTAKLLTPLREQKIPDRKSTRLNSSHDQISYAVFCLKKKTACTIQSISLTPTRLYFVYC